MPTPQAVCKDMSRAICKITKYVSAFAVISLPRQFTSAQLRVMELLSTTLLEASRLIRSQNVCSTSQPEYVDFVSDFTALLNTLVPQLARLGLRLSAMADVSSIGTTEEHVFWELWGMLVASSTAFQSLSEAWQSRILPVESSIEALKSLYAAFHDLLMWLLSMSRSPAWVMMKSEHGRWLRDHELITILLLPAKCLTDMTLASMPTLFSHMNLLPSTFLPLLCCIVSEHISDLHLVPRQTQPALHMKAMVYKQASNIKNSRPPPLYQFLYVLVILFNNLSCAEGCLTNGANFPFLTSPSMLQLLKLILTLPKETRPYAPELARHTLLCLHGLLALSGTQYLDTRCTPLPINEREANMDSMGLPLHQNPFLNSQALQTDARLLHILGKHMDNNTHQNLIRLKTQALILRTWLVAGRLYPERATVLSQMVLSITGIAKQCTSLGLKLMQHQQLNATNTCKFNHKARTSQLLQKKQQKQSQQLCQQVLRLEGMDAALLDAEGIQVIRKLLFQASCFRTYDISLPDSRMHRSGELLWNTFKDATTPYTHTHTLMIQATALVVTQSNIQTLRHVRLFQIEIVVTKKQINLFCCKIIDRHIDLLANMDTRSTNETILKVPAVFNSCIKAIIQTIQMVCCKNKNLRLHGLDRCVRMQDQIMARMDVHKYVALNG